MNKKLKVGIIACFSALLFGVPVNAATTGTTNASVTVQSGGLNITSPNPTIDFGMVNADGTVKTVKMDLSTMNVADFTGSGSGWNVNVSATQFSDGTHTIPLNSLKLMGINTITPVSTASPAPSVVGAGPYTLDSGSAQKVLSASAGNGMGSYNVAFVPQALQLTLDTSTVAPSASPYTSTITYSIVAGP